MNDHERVGVRRSALKAGAGRRRYGGISTERHSLRAHDRVETCRGRAAAAAGSDSSATPVHLDRRRRVAAIVLVAERVT